MRLKIINSQGRIKFQFDVVTKKEAQQLYELHAKPLDKAYLYFESSMKEELRPKRYTYKSSNDGIVRANNGRILSNAEIRRMGGMGV